jgi:hypothetical protein
MPLELECTTLRTREDILRVQPLNYLSFHAAEVVDRCLHARVPKPIDVEGNLVVDAGSTYGMNPKVLCT